mgnify:CR=1 FL=1
MIKSKTLTPLLLAGIFVLMLGLSFAAVPLYDLFCRVTGFGGTTQVSKEAPKIVLDKVVSVRFDTNVNNLEWNFKAKSNVIDVKVGQVNRIEFEVENIGDETTYGVASFNVSPASFGKYYSKLGCFCFEKQELKAGEKATYVMTFYLDPELVKDPTTKNLQDVNESKFAKLSYASFDIACFVKLFPPFTSSPSNSTFPPSAITVLSTDPLIVTALPSIG